MKLTTKHDIDPGEFTWVGPVYLGHSEADADADAFFGHSPSQEQKDATDALLTHFSHLDGCNGANCEHCGTHFKWGDIFRHTSGKFTLVGWKCGEATFAYPTKAALIKSRMERAARQAAKQAKIKAEVARYLAERPVLIEAFKTEHHIISDIKSKLNRYGCISDKQAALVLKIAQDETQRAQQRGQWAAERAEQLKAAPAIEAGRQEIAGVVLSVKYQPTDWGDSYKLLIQADNGNRFWGTLPSASQAAKGDRIRITATVKLKDGEDHFACFSRPYLIDETYGDDDDELQPGRQPEADPVRLTIVKGEPVYWTQRA